jgi:hypothetical protein
MEQPVSTNIPADARATPWRLGALALAIGALVTALAVVAMDWIRTAVPRAPRLDSVIPGADLWEGKVVFGFAVVALVVVAAGSSREANAARRTVGWIAFTVTALIVVITALSTAAATDRERERVRREEPFSGAIVRLETGPWVALAGGLMANVGAVLMLWSARPSGSDQYSR